MIELFDKVEIINVDGLNKVFDWKKGNKELIGIQGYITNIYELSVDCIYYVVDLPVNIPRIVDGKVYTNGKYLFRDKNLKLIKKGRFNKMSKKEQLLNELEQIKKEFNEKIENVQKQIEEEDNKNKWWTPNDCVDYWFIRPDGIVCSSSYRSDHIDRVTFLNTYKTKEEAERLAFEELLHRKLKKFAYENNAIVDWSNDDSKYNIWYDYQENKLDIGNIEEARDFGQIYFSSEDVAEKAIEEFKDDLIRYFTSDK